MVRRFVFSKRWRYVAIIVAGVAVLSLPFVFQSRPTATLVSGGHEYTLEIVASKAAQAKGLGGRESLAQDRGMLFVFEKPSKQCFWMKDMQFPIDIIWLDSTKKVTSVVPDVSPDSYPLQYCGDNTTKYVIELNAGEAKRADIKLSDSLQV